MKNGPAETGPSITFQQLVGITQFTIIVAIEIHSQENLLIQAEDFAQINRKSSRLSCTAPPAMRNRHVGHKNPSTFLAPFRVFLGST
jgi:hypothetical protein